jgi:SulP family sulfate permease
LTPSVVAALRSGYGLGSLRDDLFGGVTAAVVALPLALALGVASGAGPMAGLYGAIATGFFAAFFGGTPAQITGPTGPMTVVMGAIVASHSQSLAEAFTIVMLGGLLQILFGMLRAGKYVSYTPASVVSGFMTGVGIIIMIIQSLPLIGSEPPSGGVLGTFDGWASLSLDAIDRQAMLLATGALLLLALWPRRLARLLPAPLAVLVLATAIATLGGFEVPVIGPVPSGLPELVRPTLITTS